MEGKRKLCRATSQTVNNIKKLIGKQLLDGVDERKLAKTGPM